MAATALPMMLGKHRQRLMLMVAAASLLAACTLALTGDHGSASAWAVAQPANSLRLGGHAPTSARLGAQRVEALGQSKPAAGMPTALLGAGLFLWAAAARSQRSVARAANKQAACRVSLAPKPSALPIHPVERVENAICESLPLEGPPVAAAAAQPNLLPDFDEEEIPAATPLLAEAAFVAPAAAPVIGQTAATANVPHPQRAGGRCARGRRTRRNAFNGQREQRRNVGARLQERVAAEPRVIAYDSSRVPVKLQNGLQMKAIFCDTHNREARVQNDSMTLTLRVDTVSQLKVLRFKN